MNKIGLIKILLFNDSRKIGLGVWIYFVGTGLLLFSMVWNALHPPVVGSIPIGITFDQYVLLLGLATTLVGGGSIYDKRDERLKMKIQADANVPPAA